MICSTHGLIFVISLPLLCMRAVFPPEFVIGLGGIHFGKYRMITSLYDVSIVL